MELAGYLANTRLAGAGAGINRTKAPNLTLNLRADLLAGAAEVFAFLAGAGDPAVDTFDQHVPLKRLGLLPNR